MSIRRFSLGFILASASAAAIAAEPQRIVLPDDVVPTNYVVSVVPDPGKLTFNGTVKIDIAVKNVTREIKLNAADLAFRKAGVIGMAPPKISFDKTEQTVTLSFGEPLKPGPHLLMIDYSGKINQHPAGLFALDYDTPKGTQRALFTQFENSDARRFMPCWDEPGIKATFTLIATVPSDSMPVSNMPAAKTTEAKGGLERVEFAPTPKMSSYLLFFGDGDFERIHRTVDGVDVGVIVKRGDAAKGQYVLDAAVQILPYYEDYFAVKYPLPKLDLIAGPGQSQSFGAMENWGAIFSFEYDLLVDPHLVTEDDRRRVFEVTAHEMAHQWFGDLVTMAWWDDIWLNEGYASWMEIKAAERFHPDWKPWLDKLGDKEAAMAADSRSGTHPIITPIRDVLQADQAFDAITYEKGESVIRMLEAYVGADAWRDGVRAYMKAHAYGNTVSDDLWREMDTSTKLPVTQVAHDFTLQAGVPLIRVTSLNGGVKLSQERYAVDDSGKAGGSWHVPVTVASFNGANPWHSLVSKDAPAELHESAGSVNVVGYGQTAYFRTLYDAESFKRVSAHFASLAPADQWGLLSDSLALGYAGDESMGDFLSLTTGISPDMDPLVLDSAVSKLGGLNFYYEGLPTQAAYKAYARRVLQPLAAKLGWTPAHGEDGNVTVLRTDLLITLGELDDPAVIREARARFRQYVKDPASLSGDLRRVALRTVADHADVATWDELHTLAKAAGSSLEKDELYYFLGMAHDPALAKKALDLALTDEAPVTARPTILDAVSAYYPDLALDFFIAHADYFNQYLEPTTRPRYVPRLAYASRDGAVLPKLEAYASAHIPAEDRGDVVKAEAVVRKNMMIRTQRLPDVDKWLSEQSAPAASTAPAAGTH
ncbi:MAG: M1 family metallopeptidase [Bacillota bacterium]